MNFHLEGQIVEIVVPLTDREGNAVTPTGVTAALYDGEDELVSELGTITPTPGAASVTVTILGALNELAEGNLKEARVLLVDITTATGAVRKTHCYGIEHERSLVAPKNSFQTLAGALLLSSDMVNIEAFLGASEARQKAALVEAFWKIARLPLAYRPLDEQGKLLDEAPIGGSGWTLMSAETFKALPVVFRRALAQAQILEADELLTGNVMARKHAQGIASETIGESSVTLRAGFSAASATSGGLSPAATAVLAPWINNSYRIARA